MWVSKRFDISFGDLAAGVAFCVRGGRWAPRAAAVEGQWSPAGDALATLSVRSAFDLFLTAKAWPPGSEIVFSALTVADMPRIARTHGLVPVPCDIDPATTEVDLDSLARVCTPATRAIVVAHLFGARIPLDEVAAFARQRDLEVIEDCAEAYVGPAYRGHGGAVISMFSFGPIKHATALGGAVSCVRDGALRRRMRELHGAWPAQPRGEYARRLVKYAAMQALAYRWSYGLVWRLLRALRVDPDAVTNRLTRGFAGGDVLRRIRRRPSAPLLRLLARRLSQSIHWVAAREGRGGFLRDAIGPDVTCPAAALRPHTFWIYPILTGDRDGLLAALRGAGFDATKGRSFSVVERTPDGRGENAGARAVHERAVYLPFYPALPTADLMRMGRIVAQFTSAGAAAVVGAGSPD